ncbi:MAG: hypothetical protein E7393_03925 [Ruminococcaceae bacterium]|nr:hypothetical protein [Oscillospiraceae bacterium]
MKSKETDRVNTWRDTIENFWYYHKVAVIVIIIGILIVGVLVTQHSSRLVTDLNISLVTAEDLLEESINFNEALPGLIKDSNKDGEANITISYMLIGQDIEKEENANQLNSLEQQLMNNGATLFIVDSLNYDRLIKKDAFCPLDTFFDVALYQDQILYRNDEAIAFSLKGSKVLREMKFINDDLYALLLFQRPGEENDPVRNIEYQNAVAVLSALLEQS